MKGFIKGFYYAFRGIVECICDQRNLRIHIVTAIYVLFFSQFYNLSSAKLALLILVIGAVISLELVNSAIESACDAITKKDNPMIKVAKDAAAGAVLVMAVGAVFAGVLFFADFDILLEITVYLCSTPENLTAFVLSLLASVLFIIIGPRGVVDNIHEIIQLRQDLAQDINDTNADNLQDK